MDSTNEKEKPPSKQAGGANKKNMNYDDKTWRSYSKSLIAELKEKLAERRARTIGLLAEGGDLAVFRDIDTESDGLDDTSSQSRVSISQHQRGEDHLPWDQDADATSVSETSSLTDMEFGQCVPDVNDTHERHHKFTNTSAQCFSFSPPRSDNATMTSAKYEFVQMKEVVSVGVECDAFSEPFTEKFFSPERFHNVRSSAAEKCHLLMGESQRTQELCCLNSAVYDAEAKYMKSMLHKSPPRTQRNSQCRLSVKGSNGEPPMSNINSQTCSLGLSDDAIKAEYDNEKLLAVSMVARQPQNDSNVSYDLTPVASPLSNTEKCSKNECRLEDDGEDNLRLVDDKEDQHKTTEGHIFMSEANNKIEYLKNDFSSVDQPDGPSSMDKNMRSVFVEMVHEESLGAGDFSSGQKGADRRTLCQNLVVKIDDLLYNELCETTFNCTLEEILREIKSNKSFYASINKSTVRLVERQLLGGVPGLSEEQNVSSNSCDDRDESTSKIGAYSKSSAVASFQRSQCLQACLKKAKLLGALQINHDSAATKMGKVVTKQAYERAVKEFESLVTRFANNHVHANTSAEKLNTNKEEKVTKVTSLPPFYAPRKSSSSKTFTIADKERLECKESSNNARSSMKRSKTFVLEGKLTTSAQPSKDDNKTLLTTNGNACGVEESGQNASDLQEIEIYDKSSCSNTYENGEKEDSLTKSSENISFPQAGCSDSDSDVSTESGFWSNQKYTSSLLTQLLDYNSQEENTLEADRLKEELIVNENQEFPTVEDTIQKPTSSNLLAEIDKDTKPSTKQVDGDEICQSETAHLYKEKSKVVSQANTAEKVCGGAFGTDIDNSSDFETTLVDVKESSGDATKEETVHKTSQHDIEIISSTERPEESESQVNIKINTALEHNSVTNETKSGSVGKIGIGVTSANKLDAMVIFGEEIEEANTSRSQCQQNEKTGTSRSISEFDKSKSDMVSPGPSRKSDDYKGLGQSDKGARRIKGSKSTRTNKTFLPKVDWSSSDSDSEYDLTIEMSPSEILRMRQIEQVDGQLRQLSEMTNRKRKPRSPHKDRSLKDKSDFIFDDIEDDQNGSRCTQESVITVQRNLSPSLNISSSMKHSQPFQSSLTKYDRKDDADNLKSQTFESKDLSLSENVSDHEIDEIYASNRDILEGISKQEDLSSSMFVRETDITFQHKSESVTDLPSELNKDQTSGLTVSKDSRNSDMIVTHEVNDLLVDTSFQSAHSIKGENPFSEKSGQHLEKTSCFGTSLSVPSFSSILYSLAGNDPGFGVKGDAQEQRSYREVTVGETCNLLDSTRPNLETSSLSYDSFSMKPQRDVSKGDGANSDAGKTVVNNEIVCDPPVQISKTLSTRKEENSHAQTAIIHSRNTIFSPISPIKSYSISDENKSGKVATDTFSQWYKSPSSVSPKQNLKFQNGVDGEKIESQFVIRNRFSTQCSDSFTVASETSHGKETTRSPEKPDHSNFRTNLLFNGGSIFLLSEENRGSTHFADTHTEATLRAYDSSEDLAAGNKGDIQSNTILEDNKARPSLQHELSKSGVQKSQISLDAEMCMKLEESQEEQLQKSESLAKTARPFCGGQLQGAFNAIWHKCDECHRTDGTECIGNSSAYTKDSSGRENYEMAILHSKLDRIEILLNGAQVMKNQTPVTLQNSEQASGASHSGIFDYLNCTTKSTGTMTCNANDEINAVTNSSVTSSISSQSAADLANQTPACSGVEHRKLTVSTQACQTESVTPEKCGSITRDWVQQVTEKLDTFYADLVDVKSNIGNLCNTENILEERLAKVEQTMKKSLKEGLEQARDLQRRDLKGELTSRDDSLQNTMDSKMNQLKNNILVDMKKDLQTNVDKLKDELTTSVKDFHEALGKGFKEISGSISCIHDDKESLRKAMDSLKALVVDDKSPKATKGMDVDTMKMRIMELTAQRDSEKVFHKITRESLRALERDHERLRDEYFGSRLRKERRNTETGNRRAFQNFISQQCSYCFNNNKQIPPNKQADDLNTTEKSESSTKYPMPCETTSQAM